MLPFSVVQEFLNPFSCRLGKYLETVILVYYIRITTSSDFLFYRLIHTYRYTYIIITSLSEL